MIQAPLGRCRHRRDPAGGHINSNSSSNHKNNKNHNNDNTINENDQTNHNT